MVDQYEKNSQLITAYVEDVPIFIDRGSFEDWLDFTDRVEEAKGPLHYWRETPAEEINIDLEDFLLEQRGENFFEEIASDRHSVLSDFE